MAEDTDPSGPSASQEPFRLVLDDGSEEGLEFIVPSPAADAVAAKGDIFIAADLSPVDLLADLDIPPEVQADLTVLLDSGLAVQNDLEAILESPVAAPEADGAGAEASSFDTLQPLPGGLTIIIIDDDGGSGGSFGVV